MSTLALFTFISSASVKSFADSDSCGPGFTTIDLEEKGGVFFGVPQDRQGWLGSCFANTAKNLLISASRGKDIPSFLYLTLQTKALRYDLRTNNEGGSTCFTLYDINEAGYCPVQFAPAETGLPNTNKISLLAPGTGNTVGGSAYILKSLRAFLNGVDQIKGDPNPQIRKLATNIQSWFDQLITHPEVKFPLPVVRFTIPADFAVKSSFYTNKNYDTDPKNPIYNGFLKEYESEYKKFFPTYLQLVSAGKSLDEVYAAYRKSLQHFYAKYNMDNDSTWNYHLRIYKQQSADDYASPTLTSDIQASVKFIKSITDANFSLDYLASIQPALQAVADFANQMRALKKTSNVLFKDDHSLKEDYELMKLAVTPACVDPANIKKPDFTIDCIDHYNEVASIKQINSHRGQASRLNDFIYRNLKDGYAVGETTPGHAHTIVGLRYNSDAKTCEIKIRESQTGSSSWVSDQEVLSTIDNLIEARPKMNSNSDHRFE